MRFFGETSRRRRYLVFAAIMLAVTAAGIHVLRPMLEGSRQLQLAAADAADAAQNARLSATLAILDVMSGGASDRTVARLATTTAALGQHGERVKARMADMTLHPAVRDRMDEAYLAMPDNTLNMLSAYLDDLSHVNRTHAASAQRLQSLELFGTDSLHGALRNSEKKLSRAAGELFERFVWGIGALLFAVAFLLVMMIWFGVRPIVEETEQQSAELAERAVRDSVTGAFNRARFTELAEKAVLAATPTERCAYIIAEIDLLGDINTIYGERNGDRVLAEVSGRIAGVLNEGEHVGRITGGKFGICLSIGEDSRDLVQRLKSLRALIDAPIRLAGSGELTISACFGVAVAPDHGGCMMMIREGAGEALAEAKAAGRDQVRILRKSLLAQIERRKDVLAALDLPSIIGMRSALQPKIDTRTGEVCGCEALGRWTHPRLGAIPPEEFLGLATKHGQMDKVSAILRRSALASFAQLRRSGVSIARLSINIGHAELKLLDADSLCAEIAVYGLAPHDITIELVEDVAVTDLSGNVIAEIARLRARGMHVSLDDFGSGVSSLRHLGTLEIDEVKIDRPLVAAILEDGRAHALVEAIISLAHRLDAVVTAEGVETVPVARALAALGCDRMQGWLYGKAMDEAEFIAWWRARKGAARTPAAA